MKKCKTGSKNFNKIKLVLFVDDKAIITQECGKFDLSMIGQVGPAAVTVIRNLMLKNKPSIPVGGAMAIFSKEVNKWIRKLS